MTQNEVISWIADMFEFPRENISASTQRSDIPAWDSLGLLTLMAALDEDLDIQLDETELDALQSVQAVIDVIKEHGKLDEK